MYKAIKDKNKNKLMPNVVICYFNFITSLALRTHNDTKYIIFWKAHVVIHINIVYVIFLQNIMYLTMKIVKRLPLSCLFSFAL